MTSQAPLISIISPCLNAAAFIGEMIESVRSQSGPAIEHIVLDGGSSDGTRDILASFPHLRVTVGPDEGSHDAMNRGLALTRGRIIGFINTDDRYAPRLLSAVAERFAAEPEIDAVIGRSYVVARRGSEWRAIAQHPLCRGGGFDLGDLMYGIPCFNARFFRRDVFERVGNFSLRFSFSADRHFLLRLALTSCRGGVLDRPAYFYRSHDASRTLDRNGRNARAINLEHIAIAEALLADDPDAPARRVIRAWRAYEGARAMLYGRRLGIRAAHAVDLPLGLACKLRTMAYRRRARLPHDIDVDQREEPSAGMRRAEL